MYKYKFEFCDGKKWAPFTPPQGEVCVPMVDVEGVEPPFIWTTPLAGARPRTFEKAWEDLGCPPEFFVATPAGTVPVRARVEVEYEEEADGEP